MANVEFGLGKTVFVLSIVAMCFAALWPRILYPLILGQSSKNLDSDNMDGCCDVMFESDINAIKIMNDLCGSILSHQADFNPKLSQAYQQGKLTKEVVNTCRTEVLNMCGIDIAEFLNKKEKIGHSYKQMLDEIRSFNISICLRHHFGVNPGLLGAPRRMRIWNPLTPRYLRQERPLHFRQEMLHPALREKGRAIPQSHIVPKVSGEKEFPRPMSGMRPPMGGPGHVVPPPKMGATMSIVLPLYTIGIVLFFTYTLLKIFSRKSHGDNEYKGYNSDPEFRRVVFSEDYSNGCAARIKEDKMGGKDKPEAPRIWKSPVDDSTRLGWKERDTIMSAITGLLAEVDQQLDGDGDTQNQYNTELKGKKILEEFCSEDVPPAKKASDLLTQVDTKKREVKNGHVGAYQDLREELEHDGKPKVKVVGLEMMAECEGGQKWSRPATPNLGVGGSSRSATPIPPSYGPEPQNIFLEGALPQQSQLLVSDSKTQTLTVPDGDGQEPPVILSSKMTLSLISLDAALPEENISRDQPLSQSQIDPKTEYDDNVGTADSTLLDFDSELIDESDPNERQFLYIHEEEAVPQPSAEVNEMPEEKPSLDYITATTSERAEAGLDLESEDTGVDVSNLEGLDLNEEDQVTPLTLSENSVTFGNENEARFLPQEDLQVCNGNSKEPEESHGAELLESGNSQRYHQSG